jgi:hypothetical protein
MNRCCIVCFQIQNCFAAGNSVVVVFDVFVVVVIGLYWYRRDCQGLPAKIEWELVRELNRW